MGAERPSYERFEPPPSLDAVPLLATGLAPLWYRCRLLQRSPEAQTCIFFEANDRPLC